MNALIDTHPSRDRLVGFLAGTLAEADRAAVEAHILSCADCPTVLETIPPDSIARCLTPDAGNAVTMAPATTVPDAPPADLPPVPRPSTQPYPAPTDIPADLVAAFAGHSRYRLVRLLGSGGMGAVLLAEQMKLGRQVALKVVRMAGGATTQAEERFRREARAVAALDHPNIVRVYEADATNGVSFLAMEYLRGHDLAGAGPLSPTLACEYIRQAALGLAHAHEHGRIHRDIKPANLMVVPGPGGEVVKVLDFGLTGAADTEHERPLTAPQYVMGTPEYIAPEQAADASTADARADVYSLGCTLYYLLAGRPPFAGRSPIDLILAHREQEPPRLETLVPGMPAGLGNVVRKMMAKAPADRYPTGSAIAAALAPFNGLAVAVVPPGREFEELTDDDRAQLPAYAGRSPARFPWGVVGAALAALLLLAAGGVTYRIVTDTGTLEIVCDDPDVEVTVSDGGKVVKINDVKGKQIVTLRSGAYTLALDDKGKGLQLSTSEFTLSRGGERVVTVRKAQNADGRRLTPTVRPQPREVYGLVQVVAFTAGGGPAGIDERKQDHFASAFAADGTLELTGPKKGGWFDQFHPAFKTPTDEFVFEIELKRVSGRGAFAVRFPDHTDGNNTCVFQIDRNYVVTLDGNGKAEPVKRGSGLADDKAWITLRVEGSPTRIRAFVNGNSMIDEPRAVPRAGGVFPFLFADTAPLRLDVRAVRYWVKPAPPTGSGPAPRDVAGLPLLIDFAAGKNKSDLSEGAYPHAVSTFAADGTFRNVGPKAGYWHTVFHQAFGWTETEEFVFEATARPIPGKSGWWGLKFAHFPDGNSLLVFREDGAVAIEGNQKPTIVWHPVPEAGPGGWRTYRFEVTAKSARVFVNGRFVFEEAFGRYVAGVVNACVCPTDPGFGAEFRAMKYWAKPPKPRNPWGLIDVIAPDWSDTRAFAKEAKARGAADDPNAASWGKSVAGNPAKLDGSWSSRWRYQTGGKRPGGYAHGTGEVKEVGDRVYFHFRNAGDDGGYLIETVRVGDKLIGRYRNLTDANDSYPWAGEVVSPERIDGTWSGGVWDFRRSLPKK